MIQVEHLTKYYGSHLAVEDLSFEIESGHVYVIHEYCQDSSIHNEQWIGS